MDPRKRRDRLETLENGKPAAALECSENTQEDKPLAEDESAQEDPLKLATEVGNTENQQGSASKSKVEMSCEGSAEPSDTTTTLCVQESIYGISEIPLVSSGDGAKDPNDECEVNSGNSMPDLEAEEELSEDHSQIHGNSVVLTNSTEPASEDPFVADENSTEDKSELSHGAPSNVFCGSSIEDSSEVVDISTDGGYFTAVSDVSPKCTSKAVSDSFTNDIEDCMMKANCNNHEVNVSRMSEVNTEDFRAEITDRYSCLQDSLEDAVEFTEHSMKGRAADDMHTTVQTCPETTQYCSNTCEDVVAKTNNENGSALEDSLCRLNIKESSCTDGCDTESIKSCDLHNGVLSAKNELLDTAMIQNMKNMTLCNGFEHGSKEDIMDSEKDITSKMNGHVDPYDYDSESEDISDKYKSCESVQSQASVETSSQEGSISDTFVPPATSDLPCKADATSAVDETATTSDSSPNDQELPAHTDGVEESQDLALVSTSGTTQNTPSCSDSAAFSNASNGTQPATQAVSSEAAAMADTLAMLLPNSGKGRKRRDDIKEKVKVHNPEDPDSVCGLIFVHHRSMAKIIYRLLKVRLHSLLCFTFYMIYIFRQIEEKVTENATILFNRLLIDKLKFRQVLRLHYERY